MMNQQTENKLQHESLGALQESEDCEEGSAEDRANSGLSAPKAHVRET